MEGRAPLALGCSGLRRRLWTLVDLLNEDSPVADIDCPGVIKSSEGNREEEKKGKKQMKVDEGGGRCRLGKLDIREGAFAVSRVEVIKCFLLI